MPRRGRTVSWLVGCCARSTAFAAAVGVADRTLRARPNLLTVLTYHRVDEPRRRPDLHPGLLSATPDELDRQLAFLAGTRHPVSLDELLDVRRGRSELPPQSVLVTFDDAYRDFAEHAWPIARRHCVPVTLFVPTAYPDHPERSFWWDRLHLALASASPRGRVTTPAGELRVASAEERSHAHRTLRGHLKTLPHAAAMAAVDDLVAELGGPAPAPTVLGWDELRRLREEGVTLAPHSRTHPMLDRLPAADVDQEARGSWTDLEGAVGPVPPAFAYPSGQHDPGVVDTLAEAGYSVAFTTERGNNDLERPDWLRLRRVNVGSSTTLPLLRAQLLPVALPPGRRSRRPSSPGPRARSSRS
jgi:peptidoglycan/xylan/chitin deacetylase (PgdA/CDA1 family)